MSQYAPLCDAIDYALLLRTDERLKALRDIRDEITARYSNPYTHQTALSRCRCHLRKMAKLRQLDLSPVEDRLFTRTEDEVDAYEQWADAKKQDKERFFWRTDLLTKEDIRLLTDSHIREDGCAYAVYVRALIASGRRSADVFCANFQEVTPFYVRIFKACKQRTAEDKPYDFPTIGTARNACELLEASAEALRGHAYLNAFVIHWLRTDLRHPITHRLNHIASNPALITVHSLRKLYAALLLKTYDTAPLGADEFVRRALGHTTPLGPTSHYFPVSSATVKME